MKKSVLLLVLCACSFVAVAQALELNVEDVVADAPAYVGKTVTVTGTFLYSEAMRESFTIAKDRTKLEVFYRELPANDKLFITSLAQNAKVSVTVSGTLRQYANRERSYFMDAAALRHEEVALQPAATAPVVSYADIAADPKSYVSKPVTMTGTFLFSEPMRQSFSFEQKGKAIEVLLSDLSKMDRERVLALKQQSKTRVTVTGLVQTYANDAKKFFINGYSVILEP